MQSRANPSQWISLFNRVRTGNFRHFGLKHAISTIISSRFQSVARDFPKTKNREIKLVSGNFISLLRLNSSFQASSAIGLITGDLIPAQEAGRLCLLPDQKLTDKEMAIVSLRRLADLPLIDTVLTGDGWPVFRGGAKALAELAAEFD